MLDLNLLGDKMMDVTLIRAMEQLLYEKLMKQDQCLRYFDLLDDDVRYDLLKSTFDKIDADISDIQDLDLLFMSLLDKIKRLENVQELTELDLAKQSAFELIQKSVAAIQLKQEKIDFLTESFAELKLNVFKKLQNDYKISTMHSAYKNINK